jgi:hypothetical protein
MDLMKLFDLANCLIVEEGIFMLLSEKCPEILEKN